MSKKLDLKELKRPDRFLHILQSASSHIENNPRIVLWALLSIVVALVAGGLTWNWNEKRKDSARQELYIVTKELSENLKKVRDEAKALTQPKVDPKKPKQPEPPEQMQVHAPIQVDEKLQPQVEKVKNFIQKYDGTFSAFLAQVELGNLYYENESYESAVEWFRSASRSAPNKLDQGLVLVSLGYTHENLKQYDKAIDAFQESLKSLDSNLISPKNKTEKSLVKGDILLALGRVYMSAKVPEKATQIYDQIIKELPNTPFAEKAELQKMSVGI